MKRLLSLGFTVTFTFPVFAHFFSFHKLKTGENIEAKCKLQWHQRVSHFAGFFPLSLMKTMKWGENFKTTFFDGKKCYNGWQVTMMLLSHALKFRICSSFFWCNSHTNAYKCVGHRCPQSTLELNKATFCFFWMGLCCCVLNIPTIAIPLFWRTKIVQVFDGHTTLPLQMSNSGGLLCFRWDPKCKRLDTDPVSKNTCSSSEPWCIVLFPLNFNNSFEANKFVPKHF